MNNPFTSIGFIGLGVMGEPMCHRLHEKSGLRVVVFDIDTKPLARARKAGITVAANLEDLASDTQFIFTSLPDGQALDRVAGELAPNLRSGHTFIDTSTAPVALTRRIAGQFNAAGADYADAPVARTREAARAGTLATMVGAEDAVLARIRPLLACYATDIIHCGDVGSGQVVKILNNMVLMQTVNALAEALTIGRRVGVDGGILFAALAEGSADSFALRNHGLKALLPGDFPGNAFSTIYARKDLSYALDLAEEVGIDAQGARAVEDVLDAAAAMGLGDAYWPALLAAIDDDLELDTFADTSNET